MVLDPRVSAWPRLKPSRTRRADAAARGGWPALPRMAACRFAIPLRFTGLLIYLLFVLVAMFADQLAPYDPLEILFTGGKLAATCRRAPSYLLGTTNLGRDIFSQLVHRHAQRARGRPHRRDRRRHVGTVVGLVAGYFGGVVDAVLMRLADIALGLPFLPFVIVLTGFLGAEPRISCSPSPCCYGPMRRASSAARC